MHASRNPKSLTGPSSHVTTSNALSNPGITSFCEAIKQEKLRDARSLLDQAVDDNQTISLEWESAGQGESVDCLQYILKKDLPEWVKLVMRCLFIASSVEQRQRILKKNLQLLQDSFPDILEEYLLTKREPFKVGTIDVPESVFYAEKERPIAFLSSEEPGTSDNEGVVDFMIRNDPDLESTLKDNSSPTIEASLKLFPITTVTMGTESNIQQNLEIHLLQFLSVLISKDKRISVFKSEVVIMITNYLWYKSWKRKLRLALLFHSLAAAFFAVFCFLLEVDTEGASSSHHLPIARCTIGLCLLLTSAVFFNGVYPDFRLASLLIIPVLFVWTMWYDHHTPLPMLFDALEIMLDWISVLWCLLPFRHTGSFISMVRYVMWDALHFLVLMSVVLMGFGTAMYVLFSNAFAEDDKEQFNSLLRSQESLFYSHFGQFESNVVRADQYGIVAIFRNVLFVAFLFVGSIVLLNLLIAIVSDTYDRVKLTENAEIIKCRAQIMCTCHRWAQFYQNMFTHLKKWLGRNRNQKTPSEEKGTKYFYYLVPEKEVLEPGGSQKHGQVRRLRETINDSVSRTERRMHQTLDCWLQTVNGHGK